MLILLFNFQIFLIHKESEINYFKNLYIINNQRYNNISKLLEKNNDKFFLLNQSLKLFTRLYDYIRNDYKKPIFNKDQINITSIQECPKQLNKKKLGICICTIVKNENLYIREFVEYYYLLGVNKIFLFDNNDVNGESFEHILKDFVENKFIDIIDVRGLSSIQIPIYNYCYQQNFQLYDWLGFLDVDEYLYILNKENITNYLSHKRFEDCENIFFNWVYYNDNDLIRYDNRSIQDRFTIPKNNSTKGKSFVRGRNKYLMIPSTHMAGINIYKFCNSNGKRVYPKNFFSNIFDKEPKAFIKHYFTKTVEEFCNKIKRGDAHFDENHQLSNKIKPNRIKMFFKLNKITKEKVEILESCLNISLKEYI